MLLLALEVLLGLNAIISLISLSPFGWIEEHEEQKMFHGNNVN